MKTSAISLLLGLLFVAAGAAAEGGLTAVHYQAWNETIRADLATRMLVRSTTEYTYDNPVSGTPSGSRAGVGSERRLSLREVVGLIRLVRSSGFLDLGAAYGAPEDQRFYPYRLEVRFSQGAPKTVEFRSNPSYEAEPEAFRALVAQLRQLAVGTPGE